jgi:hypothetical protein
MATGTGKRRVHTPAVPLNYDDEVAAGNIDGLTPMLKYGFNPDADAAIELVSPVGNITVPTAARVHNIVSTDALDTENTLVQGVDGAYNFATAGELVDTDGTTGNDTVGSYLFIHRMKYAGETGAISNKGVVSATAAAPDSTETARIAIDAGQTQVAMFLVPATVNGETVNCGLLKRFGGGVSRIGVTPEITLQLWVKEFGEPWVRKEAIAFNTNQPTPPPFIYTPSFKVPPKAWVRLTTEISAANNEVWGEFHMILDHR